MMCNLTIPHSVVLIRNFKFNLKVLKLKVYKTQIRPCNLKRPAGSFRQGCGTSRHDILMVVLSLVAFQMKIWQTTFHLCVRVGPTITRLQEQY